jgi:hypothetical protein
MSIADKLQTIAENEQLVYEAGYKAGQQAGGGQSWYDDFWDAYQENGSRANYNFAFGGLGWNEHAFKPKYDIVPTTAGLMLREFPLAVNISDFLEQQGVSLDFSKTTSFVEMMLYSKIIGIGTVDTRSASAISYAFSGATKLQTIRLLILKDNGTQTFTNTFNNCSELQNLTIQGTIGNDLNIQHSPLLTIDSLTSIINALKDFSGTNITRTLTLHATAKALLTETDINTIAQKGWILA